MLSSDPYTRLWATMSSLASTLSMGARVVARECARVFCACSMISMNLYRTEYIYSLADFAECLRIGLFTYKYFPCLINEP